MIEGTRGHAFLLPVSQPVHRHLPRPPRAPGELPALHSREGRVLSPAPSIPGGCNICPPREGRPGPSSRRKSGTVGSAGRPLGLCEPVIRPAPAGKETKAWAGKLGPRWGPRDAPFPSRPGPHRHDREGLQRLVQAAHQRPLAGLLGALLGRGCRVGGGGGVRGVRGMGGGLHGAERLAAAPAAARLGLPNSPNPVCAALGEP